MSITGDIDIRVKVAMSDWTPSGFSALFSKWTDTTQNSFMFSVNTSGVLVVNVSTTGSNNISASSTAATGVSDGDSKWVRVTVDVDNGASGWTARFYTSDDGSSWVQLGSDVVTGTVISLFDGTSNVAIGARSQGNAYLSKAKIFYVELRNGIDGTVVSKFDPSEADWNATSWTSSDTSEVWTVNQSGSPAAALVQGEIVLVSS